MGKEQVRDNQIIIPLCMPFYHYFYGLSQLQVTVIAHHSFHLQLPSRIFDNLLFFCDYSVSETCFSSTSWIGSLISSSTCAAKFLKCMVWV